MFGSGTEVVVNAFTDLKDATGLDLELDLIAVDTLAALRGGGSRGEYRRRAERQDGQQAQSPSHLIHPHSSGSDDDRIRGCGGS